MAKSTLPPARYSLWQALNTALTICIRALEEVRTLAREPGPPGKDGLGFEDMTEELSEDGRTIIRRYVRGDVVKEFRHTFSVILDRGVWQEEKDYSQGDAVTWAGSLWIAQRKTNGKPGVGDSGWRLAVKRGAD